jgi:hypothetical protein
MLGSFKKVWTQSKDVLALQQNCEELFRRLTPIEFLDGVLLNSVTVKHGATATALNHQLTRQPVGWLVLDQTANPSGIWRTAWDAKSISFKIGAASDVTFTIWVF